MVVSSSSVASILLLIPAVARAFVSSGSFQRYTALASLPDTSRVARVNQRRVTTPTRTSLDMCAADDKKKVLFVCLGNICRSPSAEAVFKQVTSEAGASEKFEIDSCGTGGGSPNWYLEGSHSYHEGNHPDERMAMAAANRGVMLSGASRPMKAEDLDKFDLIVGMDSDNARAISTAAAHWGKSDLAEKKMRTMTAYCRADTSMNKVPDPYYGGPKGFETVLDILDDACKGLLAACLDGTA